MSLIIDIRSMRGAEGNSDHFMVRMGLEDNSQHVLKEKEERCKANRLLSNEKPKSNYQK